MLPIAEAYESARDLALTGDPDNLVHGTSCRRASFR